MVTKVLNGIDRPELLDKALKGQRLAVVTTGGAVDKAMRPTLDILCTRYHVVRLYNTILGVRGEHRYGENIDHYVDEPTGLPVDSIFCRARLAPTPGMLSDVDVVVFDIREAGVKYFEYLHSLGALMQACAAEKKPVVVLDRVAPLNGLTIEGVVCPPGESTIVGGWQLATRTAMTIGEFANYINGEFSLGCDLTVIPVDGWRRDLYFDDTDLPWMLPSISLPHTTANLLYAGMCVFEGVSSVSEGRGTSKPFELVGAPWLDADALLQRVNARHLPGVQFGKTYFKPYSSKHAGQVCSGLQIVVTERKEFETFRTALTLLDEIRVLHPDQITFADCSAGHDVTPLPSDARYTRYLDKLLCDTDYTNGKLNGDALIAKYAPIREEYRLRKEKYHLY